MSRVVKGDDVEQTQLTILQVKRHHSKEHFVFVQSSLFTELYDSRNTRSPIIRWTLDSFDFNPFNTTPNSVESPMPSPMKQKVEMQRPRLFSLPITTVPINQEHKDTKQHLEIEQLFTVSSTSVIDCFQYSSTVTVTSGTIFPILDILIFQDDRITAAVQKYSQLPIRFHLLPNCDVSKPDERNGRSATISIPYKLRSGAVNSEPYAHDIEITNALPLIHFQRPNLESYSNEHNILSIFELSQEGTLYLQQFFLISHDSQNSQNAIKLDGSFIEVEHVMKKCQMRGKKIMFRRTEERKLEIARFQKRKKEIFPIRMHKYVDLIDYSACKFVLVST